MTNFFDKAHSVSELVYQGAVQRKPEALCDADLMAALARWRQRENLADANAELLRLDRTRSFTIDYTGQTNNYWPDAESNLVGESLVRDFLFHNGLCNVNDLSVRLYVTQYKVLAIIDTEYLLVCPYPTEAGNVGGLLVVCVNQRLLRETLSH